MSKHASDHPGGSVERTGHAKRFRRGNPRARGHSRHATGERPKRSVLACLGVAPSADGARAFPGRGALERRPRVMPRGRGVGRFCSFSHSRVAAFLRNFRDKRAYASLGASDQVGG